MILNEDMCTEIILFYIKLQLEDVVCLLLSMFIPGEIFALV